MENRRKAGDTGTLPVAYNSTFHCGQAVEVVKKLFVFHTLCGQSMLIVENSVENVEMLYWLLKWPVWAFGEKLFFRSVHF